MSQSSSSGTIKLEDLIDLFINDDTENSCSTQHNTLPPHQLQYEHIDGFNITQIQESEMMVQKMAGNTSQNDGGSFLESSETLYVNSHVGVGVGNRVTHIRYGDLNCHETAYGIIDSVFGGSAATGLNSVIRCLRTELGVKGNGDRTNSRTNVKRKYRGVIENEEETAQGQGMEITKTKKRETSTTSHANREVNSLKKNISTIT
ncbi:hypothetical protein ACS0TY_032997 [Phlomoides rotata]